MLVHRLVDPLMDSAAALGAGLDWKTSLQELTATTSLGVPEYVVSEEGPDHAKIFTPGAGVGGEVLRQRQRAQQEGGRAEGRGGGVAASCKAAAVTTPASTPPSTRRDRRRRPASGRAVPELPEVEVVRAGPGADGSSGATDRARSRSCTRGRCAATSPGRPTSPPG